MMSNKTSGGIRRGGVDRRTFLKAVAGGAVTMQERLKKRFAV